MPDSRGWYGPKDGCTCSKRARKWHDSACPFWKAPVSDPAPTVEPMDDTVYSTRCDDPACGCESADNDPLRDDDKGPWFGAQYNGRCSVNECRIYEGDRIRADGQGGYECEDCGEEYDAVAAAHVKFGAKECIPIPIPDPVARALKGDIVAAAVMRRVAEQFPGSPTAEAVDRLDGKLPPLSVAERLRRTLHSKLPPEAVTDAGTMPTPEESIDFEDPTPVTQVIPELNVSGQPPARRDWLGRYIVVDPELSDFRRTKKNKPVGISRVTTFVKAASDSKALNDWGKRNVVLGASTRPDVLRRAHGLTHESDRDALDRIVGELETAAGAKVSADEGTFLHEFTELMDAGLRDWQQAPPAYQADLERYMDALKRHGLEPVPGLIERTVMVREFGGVVGTFDRVFFHRPSGTYVVGDLKTGKTLEYGMDEIQAQIWCYAHGVNQNGVYDWNTDTWQKPDTPEALPMLMRVREDVGVIVHMPVQGPQAGAVYVCKADLVKGQQYAELCASVRGWTKSKVQDWDLPAAEPTWEERFGAVTSGEEASGLWRLAKNEGVTGIRLNDLVRIAREAIAQRA